MLDNRRPHSSRPRPVSLPRPAVRQTLDLPPQKPLELGKQWQRAADDWAQWQSGEWETHWWDGGKPGEWQVWSDSWQNGDGQWQRDGHSTQQQNVGQSEAEAPPMPASVEEPGPSAEAAHPMRDGPDEQEKVRADTPVVEAEATPVAPATPAHHETQSQP